MNRYVIEGLLGDAASGKRVGVVPASKREIPDFLRMAGTNPAVVKVRRANGAEGVECANGSVEFFRSLDSIRGHSFDVLAIDDATCHTEDARSAIWPTLNPAGELIRL